MDQKSQLRAQATQILSSLNLKDLSLKANNILCESNIWRNAKSILCYSSLRDEIDLFETINLFRKAHKNIFVPKVRKNSINPCAYTQSAEQLNKYPSSQLIERPKLELDFTQLDLLLIPGLMFDSRGYRLGRGMGFYDRFLSQIRPEATTIGIIPSKLIVKQLTCLEAFDLPVKYLLSEKGIVKCEYDNLIGI